MKQRRSIINLPSASTKKTKAKTVTRLNRDLTKPELKALTKLAKKIGVIPMGEKDDKLAVIGAKTHFDLMVAVYKNAPKGKGFE